VRQTHGDDLANPIGKRNFVTYDRGKRKAAYKKDEHELKRGHLLAGTPPYDADNQDQEKYPMNARRTAAMETTSKNISAIAGE
jgi:hypothetical protein